MRGGLKITPTSGEYSEQSSDNLSGWMKEFAKNADKYVAASEAKTAVEVSRERKQPSIYEQMYAILNGKRPIYSSVEEAVQDYQEKTGLSKYLNNIQASEAAKQVIAASLDAIDDEDEEKKKPRLLLENPAIENYIQNVINTNPHVDIPAVLHGVGELFARDGLDGLHDSDLFKYINKMLIAKGPRVHNNDMNLGRGVGIHNDFGDYGERDPFASLRPNGRTHF